MAPVPARADGADDDGEETEEVPVEIEAEAYLLRSPDGQAGIWMPVRSVAIIDARLTECAEAEAIAARPVLPAAPCAECEGEDSSVGWAVATVAVVALLAGAFGAGYVSAR